MFQFDTLFGQAPLGVYVVDADLRVVNANPIAKSVFGQVNLLGHNLGDLVASIWPARYADEIVYRFRRTLETGEPYFVPEKIEERLDLEKVQCFEWQISRIALPEGGDGVLCYFRDVSERVATQSKLYQSERRYHQLFNSIDEGYCVLELIFDADQRPVDYVFLEVNKAFEQQSGMHEPTGKRMLEMAPHHEAHWFETYGMVAKTGEPVRFVQRAKELGDRWFDLYAFRLGGADSRKVAVVFSNITDRVRSERALRESEERYRTLFNSMAELDRRKDEFLAMLSHELRNPMAPLWNAAEVLRLRKLDDPLQQEACGIIGRQVGNLKRLVDELLEVSRLTSGRVRLQQERISLADVVVRALETTRPLVLARGHELQVLLPEAPAWVLGDPARLEQVVINLVTNAAKYTLEGGRIRLMLRTEEGSILLEVRDNGVGISEDLLPDVFDLFTQGERSLERSEGGLGIGLSIVKRLVELHGGTVTVASELGQGSTFTVRLPALATPPPERSSDPVGAPLPASAPEKACRVLVVDDNVDGAQVLNILLTASGHQARMSHDGLEAVHAAEEFQPDVILLDIGLPGLDGYEVAKRVRQHPELSGVVLVAMTGYGQDTDKQLAEDAGFDHHLVKPADFAQVEAILRGERRMRHRHVGPAVATRI